MNIFDMNPEQRKNSIELTAQKMRLPNHIVEKDYWVVWSLWRIFSISNLKDHLTFKGGTSLSKIFGLIKRFSEDLDLSIEKDFFGFKDDLDHPSISNTKKKKKLIELSNACSSYVQNDLKDILNDDFSKQLQGESDWNIKIDEVDPDNQTLLFQYPLLFNETSVYVRPVIKLEMGARSEHWPVSWYPVHTYLHLELSDKIQDPQFKIRVLQPERTFWEKATILHAFFHKPQSKALPRRIARHYYDMHCLLNSEVKKLAENDFELLDRVIQHKINYFSSSWSNFHTAKKGSLKLVPSPEVESELVKDYNSMKEMFFEDIPKWNDIMNTIKNFEMSFNQS
jgi:predicted nucleotidyltransferase component of viral defense system